MREFHLSTNFWYKTPTLSRRETEEGNVWGRMERLHPSFQGQIWQRLISQQMINRFPISLQSPGFIALYLSCSCSLHWLSLSSLKVSELIWWALCLVFKVKSLSNVRLTRPSLVPISASLDLNIKWINLKWVNVCRKTQNEQITPSLRPQCATMIQYVCWKQRWN